MDPLTALAALLPLGIEAGKGLIQRFIAPDQVRPITHQDAMEARRLDLELFQAMQGGEGASYPWVTAVRQLQRPAFAAVVLLVWAYQTSAGQMSDTVTNMTAAVGFYLFGDRTLFHMTGRKP